MTSAEITPRCCSMPLQRTMTDFGADHAFAQVPKKLREHYGIDVPESTAQKTKVYDPYARFLRWASDRLQDNGIISFIINRGFIDTRTFDGFRKCLAEEFDFVYIADTQSDVRKNPKISGTKHNRVACLNKHL